MYAIYDSRGVCVAVSGIGVNPDEIEALCDRNSLALGRKAFVLKFLRSELLYDIKNYAFIEGDAMRTQDEHDRHLVFDVGEDGNIDRVTRVLSLVHSECQEMLYPYTKSPVDTEDLYDMLVEDNEYVITLSVPVTFSKTTADYMEKLIHEFMVCRVMEDWMGITNPAGKMNWAEKAEITKYKILSCRNNRIERTRKVMRPF